MADKTLYALDPEHPIPNIDVVDVNTVKKGGGSDLFIVVATRLSGDYRSLKRLMRKIERYLEFMHTSTFRTASGIPTPKNTNIIVKIHADSDPTVFELLERNRQWIANNDATLIVDTIPSHLNS